jgi:hypothetical protein
LWCAHILNRKETKEGRKKERKKYSKRKENERDGGREGGKREGKEKIERTKKQRRLQMWHLTYSSVRSMHI